MCFLASFTVITESHLLWGEVRSCRKHLKIVVEKQRRYLADELRDVIRDQRLLQDLRVGACRDHGQPGGRRPRHRRGGRSRERRRRDEGICWRRADGRTRPQKTRARKGWVSASAKTARRVTGCARYPWLTQDNTPAGSISKNSVTRTKQYARNENDTFSESC